MSTQYKYTIAEQNDDPMQVIILKEGITAKFTLQELESDRKRVEKILQQLESQKQLDEAQAQNVLNKLNM